MKKKLKTLLIMGMFLTSVLLIIIPTPSSAGENWWNNNWDYRKLITINSSDYKNDVYNYPVGIKFIFDADLYDHANVNMSDIRFVDYTDNSTNLSYEIENYTREVWVVGGVNMTCWVNVTYLSSTTDTLIWLYYNNSVAPDAQDSTKVWDANYVGVWHLDEAGVTCYDSSMYSNDGTKGTGTNSPTLVTQSLMGNAQYFNGTYNGYFQSINVSTSDSLNLTDSAGLSIETISSNLDVDATSSTIIDKQPPSAAPVWRQYHATSVGKANTRFHIGTIYSSNFSIVADEWYFEGGTWDNSSNLVNVYVNKTIDFTTSHTDDLDANNRPVTIGFRLHTASQHEAYNGTIDEIRVSNIARNNTWINMTVDTFLDTEHFLTIGEEEARSAPVPGFVCSPVTPDAGTWAFSETVSNGTMNELWTEDDLPLWAPYDASGFWSQNYTYSYYREGGVAGLNASLLNTSGMERFQSVMWIHNNGTDDSNNNITQGFYIEGCGGNWTYIGAGPSAIYAIAYNGTTEYDLASKKPISLTDPTFTNVTNYFNFPTGDGITESGGEAVPYYWEITPWDNNGSWLKLIYDDNCQCFKFKCWGDPTMVGLMQEPAGWPLEYCEAEVDLFNCSTPCVGIATWDPSGNTNRSDFDIISFYLENYSINGSHLPPEYPLGQPFMEFVQLNASTWKTNFTAFYNATEAGNLSVESIIPYLRTFTNATMKNSRPFAPNDTALDLEPWEQNDTVRYHSWVFYNSTEIGPAWVYDNYLILYIHETSNGYGPSSAGDPYSCLAINVDGDDSWDPNDRLWYMDTSGIRWQFNGNNSVAWNINGTIYQTNQNGYQNLYRYNNHTHSIFIVPLAELVKEDGYSLNESDMFNMSIFTGSPSFANINFWQNWNESACLPYYGGADELHDTMKEYFINDTYVDNTSALKINASNLVRWGLGQITGGVTLGPEYVYDMTVTKEANITTVTGSHSYYPVRYYINVTNTGTGTLTDIYINETLYNCSCSDYKMTYLGGNQDPSNITFYNDSCYMIIHNTSIEPLASGNTWSVWFDVNLSNCTGDNLGIITNNVTVNATELGSDETASDTVIFSSYAVRYNWRTIYSMPAVDRTSNSIFAIIGILLIVGAIMTIVALVMKSYQ